MASVEAEARLPGARGVRAKIKLMTWQAERAERGAAAAPPLTPKLDAWPAPAKALAPAPAETEALLRRLPSAAPGPAREAAVAEAAARLAARLGDPHWLNFYRSRCREAAEGKLATKILVGAWKASRSGTANNPGAVFAAFVKEHAAQEKNRTAGTCQQQPRRPAVQSVPGLHQQLSMNGGPRKC